MRISACLLLILGALVLVWGLGDLWNLLTIWREAVSRYGGEPSLLRLGGAQLAAGVVKSLFGLGLLAFGGLRLGRKG